MFVGRISVEKNIEFLIECHKSLNNKCQNIKLLIVGQGPDIDKIKNLVTEMGCEDSVIFTGKIPFSDMPSHYQLAHITVTASKAETQGLTIIESIAASVPVVCAEDESFANMVNEDLNGYMFTNKTEYKNIILDLYENRDKLNRLQKQARISANDYSSSHYASKIVDVYRIAIHNLSLKKPSIIHRIKRRVGKRNEKDDSSES
jgi:1,2-diacylglycerol 3-alpha-glucosyltransferase